MDLRLFSLFIISTSTLADPSTEGNYATDDVEESTECNKSLFHERDLQLIIDFVENSLSIRKKINDTIQLAAVPVRDKHLQRINSSIELFASDPEHLKDVLEVVSNTRQKLLKLADAIEKNLILLPNFTSVYQQKLYRKSQLLKKFQRQKKLCEIHCGLQEVEFRRAVRKPRANQFCGSVLEIHTIINQRLENFTDKLMRNINEAITRVEREYDTKITTKVKELKDEALQEFGGTVYQILNLLDMYHHLKKDLKEFDTDWQLELRELNIKADVSLLELNNMVNDFENDCNGCNKVIASPEEIEERQQVANLQNGKLLDSLINNKLDEIQNVAEIELHTIFQEIDKSLEKVNIDYLMISHLSPIRKEIVEMTNKEINAFNALRISNVTVNIGLMKKLIADTKEIPFSILKTVQKMSTHNENF